VDAVAAGADDTRATARKSVMNAGAECLVLSADRRRESDAVSFI
jgi:hypothetical protein